MGSAVRGQQVSEKRRRKCRVTKCGWLPCIAVTWRTRWIEAVVLNRCDVAGEGGMANEGGGRELL
jgi:hypothetical protein